MKKRFILSLTTSLILASLFTGMNVQNVSALTDVQTSFISSIKDGALEGYKNHHILPSLTIAQAILESGWGKSYLSTEANNLFGIKAYSDWNGNTINLPTKEYNSDSSSYGIDADFKSYSSFTESIEDHSELLSSERYASVRNSSNYVDACYAIYDCGYATAPNYPEELINVIETYDLQNIDEFAKESYVIKEVESNICSNKESKPVSGNSSADLFKDECDYGNLSSSTTSKVVVITAE